MTLKRRLTRHIFFLLAGVLLLGCVAVLGISAVHEDFSVALAANEQLRQTYTIGQHVAEARSFLSAVPPSLDRARDEIELALAGYDIVSHLSPGGWVDSTAGEASRLHASLASASQFLATALSSANPAAILDPCYASLADLSAATRRAIEASQHDADRKHRQTLEIVAAMGLFISLVGIVTAIRLYHSVMRPLEILRAAFSRAGANTHSLRDPAPQTGDEEFASLAADFNRTAAQLASLYADLESRVDVKTRQLLRSERLASVGYLAAGVAHEINNPLGIIAGYSQRALQRLPADIPSNLRTTLQVICDEAFRCKQITDRLLTLSRGSVGERTRISLARLSADVVESITHLPRAQGRRITLESPESDESLYVRANESELRQVLLNLLVNAIEATFPPDGLVHLRISRDGPSVELVITDNGRGMSADTLASAFEPFYTEKTGGADRPAGTGLGLSLAHAIVTDHAGQLDAQSPGLGLGSIFILRLSADDSHE